MNVTPESVLDFLEKVDVALPKLQAFLTGPNLAKLEAFLQSATSNPALINLADKLFPGMGAVVSMLAPFAGSLHEIAPVISFFQEVLDLFLNTVHNSQTA